MKRKLQKVIMAIVAITMFTGIMLLSVEKNNQGQWEFATISSLAQGGENGGGEDNGGGEQGGDEGLWIRCDEDCVYTFEGEAGAEIKIFGGTVITIGGDGTATYTVSDAQTTCTAGGNQQCTSRYCESVL